MYNGVPYAYVKNLQGDVIAILDSAGAVVVSYVYDAWGMPSGKAGTLASTLGTVQPFRYRGYVYDEETGLYYLRSRYYNSAIGRFCNADWVICYQELLNIQLFNYCINNPILCTDPNGDVWVMGVYAPFYGYYHQKVQEILIAENANMSFESEKTVGDTRLRADLYSTVTNEIYEIKPKRESHMMAGYAQLAIYEELSNGSMVQGTTSLVWSEEVIDEKYGVLITIEQYGPLIVYSLKRNKKAKQPETVSVKEIELPPVTQTVLEKIGEVAGYAGISLVTGMAFSALGSGHGAPRGLCNACIQEGMN